MIWPTGFYAWNVGSPGDNISGSIVAVNPRNRNFDGFDGGKGEDTILMTSESDVLVLDDQYSANGFGGYVARIKDIEIIDAGAGDDVVDLTSFTFVYGDVTVKGGDGNDLLWTSAGDDIIYGGAGDDHIDGGVGDDILVVGEGTDQIYGRLGDDFIVYDTLDDNADRIYGFETGKNNDVLNLTDILEGYDSHHDDIHDFVSLTQLATHTALNVNADGDISGAYTRIAYFQGGISETIDQLLTNGNLIVDQSANI